MYTSYVLENSHKAQSRAFSPDFRGKIGLGAKAANFFLSDMHRKI
jgi:hypothetical protein